jgi:hypothetical protein
MLCVYSYCSNKDVVCLFVTSLNILKYSNVSPKVKIMEEKKVGIHSLVRNIFGVRGVCWSFKMKIKSRDKCVNYSY